MATAEEFGPEGPVNVHEAKTHLSRLLARVERGEEIVIARAGRPVAKLIAIDPVLKNRPIGAYKGKITMSEDFDDPMSWQSFPGFPPE